VSRFNSAFARAAVARDRAFGIAAQYRHGDDVLGVTLLLGSRDLGPRNTLGSEFAHVAVKEFSIAAATLAIDGEIFTPAAGDLITFTDPQNAEQAWTVFPIWNDRCAEKLDNAESQWRVFCASGVVKAMYLSPVPEAKSFGIIAIASTESSSSSYDSDSGDAVKAARLAIQVPTDALVANGITGLERKAIVTVQEREWTMDMERSKWAPAKVTLGLMRREITRHEEMEVRGTL
jgi:hypothetical protein